MTEKCKGKTPSSLLAELRLAENLRTELRPAWCCSCLRWRPRDRFRPSSRYRDGLERWCRACHAEASRNWRAQNREHVELYNESRRIGPRQRECVDCGASFVAGVRGPASCRCVECRRQRKIKQREALRAV